MKGLEQRLETEEGKRRFVDEARFFRGWLQRPLVMGAVSPSSRALGRKMASYVPLSSTLGPDAQILELGPGTGVVTQCLIDRGIREENLVLIEYSREFCVLLRARFPKAQIIEGDAYAPARLLTGARGDNGRFAAVVSSLPLLTRPERQREAMLETLLARMPAGRPFIQFSYGLTLPVKPERLGLDVETSPWIKRNLPPARVLVYRKPVLTG